MNLKKNTQLNLNLKMSESNQNKYSINKKLWLQPLLDYFKTIIEFNNNIEILREKLCETENFNPIKLFIQLDFEKNGFLTPKNIIYFLKQTKTNYETRFINTLIHTYDKDRDFNLNFSEFLNVILPNNNPTLKENILLSLKEKDKNMNNNIPKEAILIFNELIKQELFFAKSSLYSIKRIYDSPQFTTYDVFIDIVKSESYITSENLLTFLKVNNFIIDKEKEIKMIMFRIDADNDNKISYPDFQDIFYPIKNLENMDNINSQKEQIYLIKKEKEINDIKIRAQYGNKLNYNYNTYRYDFNRKKNKTKILKNNYHDHNKSDIIINNDNNNINNEILSYDYQNFINKINHNLEKIKVSKNNSNNNTFIEEKQKVKEENIIKMDKEKNKSENTHLIENLKNKRKNEKKENKSDCLTFEPKMNIKKFFPYELEMNQKYNFMASEKAKKEKEEVKKQEELEVKKITNDNNIKNKVQEINHNKIINNYNEIIQKNDNINESIKFYEDKNVIQKNISINVNKSKNSEKFDNLKTQNCFRFSIKNKEKKKMLIRNFSDIQQKKYNNYEYTSITERILNKSQDIFIPENKQSSAKKINKYKLNFNRINLYKNKPKNNRFENKNDFIYDKTNREIDFTNYFKFKNPISDSISSSNNKEIFESKTVRIMNSDIKIKNKSLFNLLNNYIIQDCETEKLLEKLYSCSDFNLPNLFQTFLWPETSFSFKKKFISSNDIYNTLINLGLNNITQKDIIYVFIKFNKNINKKEKINNLGFSYDEFCKIIKPKNLPENYNNKKYQKYFMGFCFKTKRIICSLFKQFIDSEKLNETYRKQLIGNEKNKYKIRLNVINLFNSIKNKNNDEYLDENDFERFMDFLGKKLKKLEKKIIMQRFDKNEDGYVDFNEFFNEIIPKLNFNLDSLINK